MSDQQKNQSKNDSDMMVGCLGVIIIIIVIILGFGACFNSGTEVSDYDDDTYYDSDDKDGDGDVDYDDTEKYLNDSLEEDKNDGDDQ